MKRSILIVICDFLILSALSLTSGVEGDGTSFASPRPITTTINNPQVPGHGALFEDQQIEAFLKKRKIDMLSKSLKSAKTVIEQKQTAISSLEKTKSQLEGEKQNLQKTVSDKEKQIATLDTEKQATLKKNIDLKSLIAANETLITSLTQQKTAMTQSNQKLSSALDDTTDKFNRLADLSRRLRDANIKLSDNLEKQKEELAKLDKSKKALIEEKKSLLKNIEKSEIELTDLKVNNKSLINNNQKLEQENQVKETMINNLQRNNRIVVEGYVNLKDLVKAKEENIKTLKDRIVSIAEEKTDLKEMISTKQTEIKELRKKLTGSGLIWEKFHQYAREVEIHMKERSPFFNNVYNKNYYLPLIDLDGKIYLAGEFKSIGFGWEELYGGQVLDLQLIVFTDKEKTKYYRVTQPVLSLNTQPQVCLIQITQSKDLKAFKPIGVTKLRKRGLKELYLFKQDGRSREADCSFLSDRGDFLLIQNTMADNKELKSETGDFIFTKEGLYVGVLISSSKCYIQPESIDLSAYTRIPLNKIPGKKLYDLFTHTVTIITDKIK